MKKPGFLRSFRTPLLLAFLTFSIFSCSLFVDSPKNGGNGHGSTQEEIDPGKKYLTRIYFNFPGDDERLVIRPNLSGSDILTRLNVDKIRLNYTIDGTDYSKTFDYDASVEFIEIALPGGNHSMFLEAIASDKVVLKSSPATKTVGPNSNINFVISPYIDNTAGNNTGTVKTTVYFPKAQAGYPDTYLVKCSIDADHESTEETITLSSTENVSHTFELTNVPVGTHPIGIIITVDGHSSVNSEYVAVYSNMVSETSFSGAAEQNWNLSIEDIQPAKNEEYALYVNGTGGKLTGTPEAVALKLNASGTSTYKKSIDFDSLQHAVNYINDVFASSSDEITIFISGEVKADSVLGFTDFSLAKFDSGKKIRLKGYKQNPSDSNPVLNAEGNGRVLKVDSGTVNIEDLTLTGGKVSGSGGGIYIANGAEVNMYAGCSVEGCKANGGGGFYVLGTFSGNGILIKQNEATNSSGGGLTVTSSGKCHLKDCVVEGNISKTQGGGMIVSAQLGSDTDPNCTAIDCTFRQNEAKDTSGGGGAIQVNTGYYFALKGGTIEGNTSAFKGGAIGVSGILYVSDGDSTPLYIPAGTDNKNDVYIANNGKIKISGSLNPPAEAGGIAATILPYDYTERTVLAVASDQASKLAVVPETLVSGAIKKWIVNGTTKNIEEAPRFVTVNGIAYYDLAESVAAIKEATGDIDVVLYESLNSNSTSMKKAATSGSIPYAIKETSADTVALSVASGNTINIPNQTELFLECKKLVTADLKGFNTTGITTMEKMFSDCENLVTLDISTFDTSSVVRMINVFSRCLKLKNLTLNDHLVTSSCTYMSNLFNYCEELEEIDVSGFDTSNVQTWTSVFMYCKKLKHLDLSAWDTSSANYSGFQYTFYYCESLETLDISNFNTSEAHSLNGMFTSCKKLKILDLSSFDTSNVTSAEGLFSGSTDLTTIIVSDSFVTDNMSDSSMFYNCTSLVGGKGTPYNSSKYQKEYARIDGGPSSATPGYFTAKPIGAKLKPNAVGDIVFKDGSATAYIDGLTLTDDQKKAAIAVIFYKGTGLNNGSDFTTERMLGVGLCQGFGGWCIESAKAYNVKIESILCEPDDYTSPLHWTQTTQVRNGKENFAKIGQYLADNGYENDTTTGGNYPAFDFAKNYKEKMIGSETESRVLGTDFEEDWYLPSSAELYKLYFYRETFNAIRDCIKTDESLPKISTGNYTSSYYWTASESMGANNDYARRVYFYNGSYNGYLKETSCAIRAIHEF